MKLTENFLLEEFTKGEKVSADILENLYLLALLMEKIRGLFNRPVTITSGYRTPERNREVGGSQNSLHLKGLACDFYIDAKNQDIHRSLVRYFYEVLHPETSKELEKFYFLDWGEFIVYTSGDRINRFHISLPFFDGNIRRYRTFLYTEEGKKDYKQIDLNFMRKFKIL